MFTEQSRLCFHGDKSSKSRMLPALGLPPSPDQREACFCYRGRGWGPPKPNQFEAHLEPPTPPWGESQEVGTREDGTSQETEESNQINEAGREASQVHLDVRFHPITPTPHRESRRNTPEFGRPAPPLLVDVGHQQHQGLGEVGLPKSRLSYFPQDERDNRTLESTFIIVQIRKLSFREGKGGVQGQTAS